MPTAKAPPIIDFSRNYPAPPSAYILTDPAFYGTDPIAKANLISQIRDACLDKGFFQLINHNISPDLQARLFSHSRSFFSLPLQEKLKLDKALSTYNRGYEFIGSQIFEAGGPPDLKEGFLLGRNLPPQHPLVLAKKFNCGPNVYPLAEHGIPDADGFKQTTDEYWTAVYGLACDLLRAIALTLGVDEEYFDGFSNDSVTTLRLLHYPVQPEGSDPLQRGIGAHTDFGAVTLLLQGDVPGLQLYEDGEWVDVAPIPGAYVANVGDVGVPCYVLGDAGG